MMKERLCISFSGGRTSAYMTKMLLDNYSDKYDFLVTFANTGQEHDKTLEFVHRCDKEWGFNTVWLEAVVNQYKGTTHKIVSYESASRKGEPFEDVIKKYGISNQAWPHCTRETKLSPMRSYLRGVGWRAEITAIGIRADEKRRVSKQAEKNRIIYPLVDMFPTTKAEVISWFDKQSFDLGLVEREGNCVWCWKKSLRKLVDNYKEHPEWFDFPIRAEKKYGGCGHNEGGYKRVWLRGNRSMDYIRILAEAPSQVGLFSEQDIIDDAMTNECGESCEVYPMEEA